jgi:hypothetical protein
MEGFGLNRMVEIKNKANRSFLKGPYGKLPELPCCKVLHTCRITDDYCGCTEGENWLTQFFKGILAIFFARDVYIQGIKQVTFITIPRAGYMFYPSICLATYLNHV